MHVYAPPGRTARGGCSAAPRAQRVDLPDGAVRHQAVGAAYVPRRVNHDPRARHLRTARPLTARRSRVSVFPLLCIPCRPRDLLQHHGLPRRHCVGAHDRAHLPTLPQRRRIHDCDQVFQDLPRLVSPHPCALSSSALRSLLTALVLGGCLCRKWPNPVTLREIEDGPLGFQVWNPRVRRLFPPHAGPSHGLTRLTASSMCAVAHLSGTRAIAAT